MYEYLINLSVGSDDKPLISDLNTIQGITDIVKKKNLSHNTTQLSQNNSREKQEPKSHTMVSVIVKKHFQRSSGKTQFY